MPPTTGGSTSGSRTSERTTPSQRASLRARTTASGIPSTRQSVVLAAEVRRLSPSAERAASEVTRPGKSAQAIRVASEATGSTTNTPASSAGT
ncbi:hypothetical protein [Nocardioides convexus]|uniref:hypothetical protein n=1 Tax=Nocardioides convexus TaxID=2712224 RepID=UPI003101350A